MNESLLQIPCELIGSQTKSVTKTTKLTFESQESVPTDLIARITQLVGKTGWLVFLAEERPIDALDVVALPPVQWEEEGNKSPSQRMRAVIWRLWEKNGKQGEFDEYYKSKMNKLIEVLKEKLD